jgi:hypothetical protein
LIAWRVLLVGERLHLSLLGGDLELFEGGVVFGGESEGGFQLGFDLFHALEAGGEKGVVTGEAVTANVIHGKERGTFDSVGDGDFGDFFFGQVVGFGGGRRHTPHGETTEEQGDRENTTETDGEFES